MSRLLFLLALSFSLILSGCPNNTNPDDDDTVGDDDDATGDDDDATGDDDDSGDDDDTTGDDDDSTGDDDDATGDDDDSTGDDDDSTGDDDDSTGDDDDSTGDDDDSTGDDDDSTGDDDDSTGDDDDSTGDDDDATGDDDDSTGLPVDLDNDGSEAGVDCDDNDAANFPGNTEICDGQDNDCDATTVFTGEDTDVDTDTVITCLDCDDNDAANYPGNTEICDGQDNDCDATTVFSGEDTDVDTDGSVTCLDCDDNDIANYPGNTEICDGGDNDCDATTVFTGEDTDVDNDSSITCLDCDDGDINNFPGNTEVCDEADNDCDATTFATGEDTDVDTDGSVTCLDCDDNDIANYPGNTEICDGGDNDCDATTVFVGEDTDVDTDGAVTCLDCDDGDINNFPGNTEACDGEDNDCIGGANADAGGEADVDTDGSLSCEDCDDNDINNTPGGTEICDGQDNDCLNGADFDAAGEVDADTDGSISCLDCDDGDINNTPGGTEVCDGGDNDCDGNTLGLGYTSPVGTADNYGFDFVGNEFTVTLPTAVDTVAMELDPPTGGATLEFQIWDNATGTPSLVASQTGSYVDAGQAFYQSPSFSGTVLAAGGTYIIGVDFGSTSPSYWYTSSPTFPGTTPFGQVTSGAQGGTTPGLLSSREFNTIITGADEVDGDTDGLIACAECDDGDINNYPGNTEACDGFDNDCLNGPDFDSAGEVDVDQDTFLSCADCDDADNSAFPGNPEVCDGVDNDCDATTEAGDGETDDDNDTWLNCEDCADLDGTVNPGESEVCDGVDTNCDGLVASIWTAPATTNNSSGTIRLRGNIFLASEAALVTQFTMELDVSDGDTELTWQIFESSSQNGPWTLADENSTQPDPALLGSDAVHWSNAFGYETTPGTYYFLGVHWDVSTGYGFNTSPGLPLAASWGTQVDGGGFASAVPLSSIATMGNNGYSYPMSVITDDEGDFDTDTVLACEDCNDVDSSVAPGLPEVCDDVDNNCSGEIDNFDLSGSDSPGTVIPLTGTPTITATMDSETVGVIGSVEVTIDITHTWTGDLDISLISPTGTTIDLTSDNGSTGDNYTVTTFSDEASTSITAGTAPFNGTYVPEEPLSTFNGESPLGTWTLQVADDTNGDGGTLNSWSLEIGLDPGATVGFNESCAAADCDAILTADPLSPDDIYWIDPVGFGAFETFCDQTNDGGGWTLVANVDDDSDPFFGGNSTPYQTAWVNAWESSNTRNISSIPTFSADINASSKYYSFSEVEATDVRIAYKNDGAYFLCEGLDVVDTLDALFSTVPASDDCASVCTTWSSDLFLVSGQMPTGQGGVNCSDGNEGWYTASPTAENARIGARLDSTVYSAFLGGMGDRGYSTSIYEKTWGSYTEGVVTDDNIMLFVR